MKKLLKVNLILVFALIFSYIIQNVTFISSENFVFAAPAAITPAKSIQQQPETAVTPSDQPGSTLQTIPQKNAYQFAHMEQKGFKYAIFKFFASMLGVLLSAVVIFFGLKMYKKISLKSVEKTNKIDYDKTLESPKDFKDTINLFLDKTDK